MKDTVNELPIPMLLKELLSSGKWKHPGNKILKSVVPFFKEEVVFLETVEQMEGESHNLCEDLDWFFEKDSDKDERANSLPYRDLKKSFLIAVCKSPGDDIAIALDFRTSLENPRVIGNNWHSKIKGCPWEEISPTFEEFVNRIKIKTTDNKA